FVGKRISLPSQTVDQRQIAADLPVVPRVQRVGLHSQSVWIPELVYLARGVWQPQQKIGPRVESNVSRSRTVLKPCRVAIEYERASNRLESPALRLKVIQLLVLVVESKTHRVRASQPRDVGSGYVLIVPEQKRIPGVWVSKIRPRAAEL